MVIDTGLGLLAATSSGVLFEEIGFKIQDEVETTLPKQEDYNHFFKSECFKLAGRVVSVLPFIAMTSLQTVVQVHWAAKSALLLANVAPSVISFQAYSGEDLEEGVEKQWMGTSISMITKLFNLVVAGMALFSATTASAATLAFGIIPMVVITGGTILLAVKAQLEDLFPREEAN